MGLDQYLKRGKRIKGLISKDYERADNAVSDIPIGKFTTVREAIKGRSKEIFNELNDVVHIEGKYSNWYSIFEEVGYWRKANAIHNFFVQECQKGIDECQLSIVKKSHLQDLLKRCERAMSLKDIYLNDGVIENGEGLETFLPTRSGFFFGGTEFDEWYFNDIEQTIELITKVLEETDFERQVIFYRSSW
jgi:hypothetical protein